MKAAQHAFVAVWLGLLAPTLAGASGAAFSYGVDRLELDGNVAGPRDGVPDLVDEFEWTYPSDSPFRWQTPFGNSSPTPEEGVLYLTGPGAPLPAPGGGQVNVSVVHSSVPEVSDGAGDFAVTAYWQAVVPASGDSFHLSLWTFDTFVGDFAEIFGIGIQNFGGAVALEQHLTALDLFGGRFGSFTYDTAPVSADEVTGRIVFRIAFDGATHTVTAAASLDDGATWRTPFAAEPFFRSHHYAIFILSADPSVGPPTTTVTTTSTTSTTLPTDPCGDCGQEAAAPGVVRLHVDRTDGRDAFAWRWRAGPRTEPRDFGEPTSTRYDVCLADAAGVTVFHAALEAGASCVGSPCWTTTGDVHRYEDPSGTRDGIVRLVIDGRRGRRPSVSVVGRGRILGLPALPLLLPATVRFRAGTGACWIATATARTVRRNTTATFRSADGKPRGGRR